ncbi:hypothetical protein JCM10207_002092 [Rhodosporidiobolus poonsookiae]
MAPLSASLPLPSSLATGFSFFSHALAYFALYVVLKIAYKTFIAPRFSSLRSIPGPKLTSAWSGALGEMCEAAPGVAFNNWRRRFGDLVRFRTIFGQEALVLTDPTALNHVLVTRSYDYVKPGISRMALGAVTGPGIFLAEGDVHRRQKKLMLPAFSPAHLRDLSYIVFDKTNEMIDKWTKLAENSTVEEKTYKTEELRQQAQQTAKPNEAVLEVHSWLSALTLDVIGLAGFGYKFDTLSANSSTLSNSWQCMSARVSSKPTPIKLLLTLLILTLKHVGRRFDVERFIPNERVQSDRRLLQALEEESRRIMVDKQKVVEAEGKESMDESKDLIAILLRANWGEAKAPLSPEELRAALTTFLLAGHETSSNQVSWALYYFCRTPRVHDKLREEVRAAQADGELDWTAIDKLEYLDAVVHEILRFEPVAPTARREATTDDVLPLSKPVQSATDPSKSISSVPIKKGQQLFLPVYAVHRNPDVYGEDADEFRPERWLETDEEGHKKIKGTGMYGVMTFLNGPRGCIGYRLAIMEVKIMLALLLSKFTFSLREPDMRAERRAELITRSLIVGEEEMGPRMVLRVGLAK